MNKEELFAAMEHIDETYIVEAKQKKHTGLSWVKWGAAAACLLLLICFGIYQRLSDDRNEGLALHASAAEIGKEEIHFGATMPRIIYADDNKVIMYDYVGIWVYDMNREELVGFCDFRPINMTQIQGYPCVLVEATDDGKYVKFYMSDESIFYIYDVEKNSYKQVNNYDNSQSGIAIMENAEDRNLSQYASTYILSDGTYISYTLDISGKSDDEIRYGDLVIIKEENGTIKEYRPFSRELYEEE